MKPDKRTRLLVGGSLFAGILLLTCGAYAQEYRGTITGVVSDPTGAPIPDVTLKLRNIATSVMLETKTTSAGLYVFHSIEPGSYNLRAEHSGFEVAVVPDLVVGTGAAIGMNLQMKLGTISQTVEVRSETPLLNTVTADSGQVITGPEIQQLPLNGQSPYILARLAPGVIVAGAVNQTLPYNVSGNSYVSIGGSRRYTTAFVLNGVPNLLAAGYFPGRVAYTPPADATAEFRVVTNGFSAQYGGYSVSVRFRPSGRS